jgi:hypothetical protein
MIASTCLTWNLSQPFLRQGGAVFLHSALQAQLGGLPVPKI